ncbi:hypothetical protein WME99_23265 [Sorangium sp. So ce136]|uniref:hypothetical protein n=1 Tax=Sorangium sp. So ce136 TaxID=3133284 RepID=UPI003F0BF190
MASSSSCAPLEPGGATLTGRIERVAPEVDTSTHMAFAEASIDGSKGEAVSGLEVRVTRATTTSP